MLVLVPSRFELDRLREGGLDAAVPGAELVVVGVGLAEAGARSGVALAKSPAGRLAVLVGLAGTLDVAALPVGGALVVTDAEVHGIGVGSGASFRPWVRAGGPMQAEAAGSTPTLEAPALPGCTLGPIVSVVSASVSPEEAAERRLQHPACLAEDMETHAVALAAAAAHARLVVLRGASNEAGDRRHACWRVDDAVAGLLRALGAVASLERRQ